MGSLRDAFDQSVEASVTINRRQDAALIAAGQAITDRVDSARDAGEGSEVTKALYLLPHLMNILREMYATPRSREESGIGKEDARGKLAAVRDLRSRPAPTKKRA